MRLINVRSLDIEEFFGDDIPEYAILSHTWGTEEVTLQEWSRRQEPSVSSKSGYKKIVSACRLASIHRWNYVWVDTNCIDKTSSAELSEAINSMYTWYSDAQVCFVHLQDVVFDPTSAASIDLTALFQSSRWFTRGWTLQELLAPVFLRFYDKDWTHMTDKNLCLDELSLVTSIPTHMLEFEIIIHRASIAQRMSWLSRRKTTRREDMAYCMFGLFGVNLPLLYGEGDRAFTRLQEELIRSSYDHTIFCWSWPELIVRPEWLPALAPCAAAFADAGKYIQRPGAGIGKLPAEYAVTNVGIRIQLPILCSSAMTCYAVLDVYVEGMGAGTCVAIPLQRPATIWTSETVFWRAKHPNGPVVLPHSWAGRNLDVRLAKPGTQPTDHGYSNDALMILARRGTGYWPRVPHSRFAVLTLERLGAGAPTQPLCTRGRSDGGVVFMEPTSVPAVWCCRLQLFGEDADQEPNVVTVILHESQGRARWSVSRAPTAEIEDRAAEEYNHGTKSTLFESQGDVDECGEYLSDQVPVTVAKDLELPMQTQGMIAGVRIIPLLIQHTHHYKEQSGGSGGIYTA